MASSFPLPNPGGNARALVRKAVATQIANQNIAGLVHVYSSVPPKWNFDQFPTTSTGMKAMCAVHLGTDTEAREAYTGAADRGGVMVTYDTTIYLEHWTYDPSLAQDDDTSEDDYDRIYEALKDTFRGELRDLGRLDAGVLFVGEWPRESGKVGEHPLPLIDQDGSVLREGTLTMNTTQYRIQYPTT